jgi:hypothetical protein
VLMAKTRLPRSGVKHNLDVPFSSGSRGREAPPYRNLGYLLILNKRIAKLAHSLCDLQPNKR